MCGLFSLNTTQNPAGFLSPAPPLPPASFSVGTLPGGPWGSFDYISFSSPSFPMMYEVRYHSSIDAFTFHYHVSASPFPFFGAASSSSAAAGLISFSESYMLPGARSNLSSCAGVPLPHEHADPSCPNLSGEWCCDWVSVSQVGAAITSAAVPVRKHSSAV